MEASIRAQFEKVYAQRVACLRKFYEMKHETLRQTLQDSYAKVLDSELLHAMVQDETTLSYAKDMIIQLFQRVIGGERDLVIENLGLKLSQISSQLKYSQAIIRKLKDEVGVLNHQLTTKDQEICSQRAHYENKSTRFMSQQENLKDQMQKSVTDRETEIKDLKDEIRRLGDQLTNSKICLTEREVKLKVAQKKCDDVNEGSKDFAKVRLDLELDIRQLEFQVSRLTKQKVTQEHELRTGVIKMLQNKVREMQANSREIQETMKTQFNHKSLAYKKKLQEYKHRQNQLANRNGILQKKLDFSNRNVDQLENKLSSLLQENQRSLAQYRSLRDRQRMDMEKKYQYQLKEFQSHYERLLQTKINEVEDEAASHLNSMKDCEKQYQLMIEAKSQEYDNNFISRREFETRVRQKQQTIDKQVMTLHEKELESKGLEFKITMSEDKKCQLQKEVKHKEGQIGEYQQLLKQQKVRRKGMQVQLETTRTENKKYRKLISEFQQKLKNINVEVDQKNKVSRRTKEKNQQLQEEVKSVRQISHNKGLTISQLSDKIKLTELTAKESQLRIEAMGAEISQISVERCVLEKKLMQTMSRQESGSQELLSLRSQHQGVLGLLKITGQQNARLTQQLDTFKRKESEQAQNQKVSLTQITQKYADFKALAIKLQSDSKTKDELISHLQSANQSLLKRKRKLQEAFRRLSKNVGDLKHGLSLLKETLTSSTTIIGKELQLLQSKSAQELTLMVKSAEDRLSKQKESLSQIYQSEISQLWIKMSQGKSSSLRESQMKTQHTQRQLKELCCLLLQLQQETQQLKSELSSSKNMITHNVNSSVTQITNLQSLYVTLERQYLAVKEAYRCLLDQHQKSQSLLQISTQQISENESNCRRLQGQLDETQKQFQETVGQNEMLKDRKNRLQCQISQMKSIVSRAAKNPDSEGVKLAKMLDVQTRQLTKKVEILRKMGCHSATKEMLRG